jgi:tetratricopeptide (TPR) repeat protein
MVFAFVPVLILLAASPVVIAQERGYVGRGVVPAPQTAAPAPSVTKAVMHGGHPAVECTHSEREGITWSIEQADLDGKPAFKIPMATVDDKVATLLVAADQIALKSQNPQDSFDESRADVTWKFNGRQVLNDLELRNVKSGHKSLVFAQAVEKRYPMAEFSVCASLVEMTFTDFSAAEKKFDELTKHLHTALAFREFQQKAAAWRALPAKPPISDDVKQHRLLAEDAYQQKQFDTAAAEYEAGLEIDPLWAQGHFNAAVIYGELKDYDDAVWHMRCYLELLPNAPDAQDARDQMLLWQGKLKQQAAAQ